MKLIRKLLYVFISNMIFHHTVSAHEISDPFTATPVFYLSNQSDTSTIISFKSVIDRKKILLSWTVDANQMTDRFEIERSLDGKTFVVAALVFGTDKPGMDDYRFFERRNKLRIYYRVKTIARDGSVDYSKTILVEAHHVH